MKQKMTGAQAIIATLRAYHTDTIFGIPGVHTLPLYDALRNEPNIRHVLARHEQGAGFMAEGYARASGKPGVVLTITGPGVTNVATPVASAYADSIPLLVISSSLPRASIGGGELHEVKNQLGVMEALAGWARAVEQVEEIPAALQEAFHIMQQGRPRGAYLQVPLDLLEMVAEVEIPAPSAREPIRPAEQAITTAAKLLREAQKPVIIAGAGVTASGANDLLAQLAEALQAPVILSSKSHDVLPTNHPFVIATNSYIPPELRQLTASADVALVVGSKLALERTAYGKMSLPSSLIQIDIDPDEIGRNYPVAVSVVADALLALDALLHALHDTPRPVQGWTSLPDEIAHVNKAARQHTLRRHGEAVSRLDTIRSVFPRDGIVVADMTMLGYASAQYFPVYEPRTFIHPHEFCTIGCGLPLALGAKIAAPDRQVIALCGDGGFLLNAGELATAAQEQLPITVVIFNDSTYSAVKASQQIHFNSRYIATDLVAPDYVTLAQAFHATGIRVQSEEELHEALQRASGNDRLTLIEVMLPPKSW